jgi:CRP-like cAMP-binding protein
MNSFAETLTTENHLLRSLGEEDLRLVFKHSHHVDLEVGDVLHDLDDEVEYVYFPESGVVSMILFTDDGASVEIGITGRDGMVGTALILKSKSAMRRAQVQVAGTARRLTARRMEQLIRTNREIERVLLRYLRRVVDQESQIAVCNARHTLERRLARWLLMINDLVESDNLPLTHEFIANMLGSRRAGVTQAAGTLKDMGALDYSRGFINILDRDRLEKAACECYQAIEMANRS